MKTEATDQPSHPALHEVSIIPIANYYKDTGWRHAPSQLGPFAMSPFSLPFNPLRSVGFLFLSLLLVGAINLELRAFRHAVDDPAEASTHKSRDANIQHLPEGGTERGRGLDLETEQRSMPIACSRAVAPKSQACLEYYRTGIDHRNGRTARCVGPRSGVLDLAGKLEREQRAKLNERRTRDGFDNIGQLPPLF